VIAIVVVVTLITLGTKLQGEVQKVIDNLK
jgi:hypothetical protein